MRQFESTILSFSQEQVLNLNKSRDKILLSKSNERRNSEEQVYESAKMSQTGYNFGQSVRYSVSTVAKPRLIQINSSINSINHGRNSIQISEYSE